MEVCSKNYTTKSIKPEQMQNLYIKQTDKTNMTIPDTRVHPRVRSYIEMTKINTECKKINSVSALTNAFTFR